MFKISPKMTKIGPKMSKIKQIQVLGKLYPWGIPRKIPYRLAGPDIGFSTLITLYWDQKLI